MRSSILPPRDFCGLAILKETEADLALALLRYKSVVLDSIIEDRLVAEASKESKDLDLVGRLAADKRLLGQLLLQSPNRPSTEPNNRIENLACIAHKSSEICERCRLRQQNPPRRFAMARPFPASRARRSS